MFVAFFEHKTEPCGTPQLTISKLDFSFYLIFCHAYDLIILEGPARIQHNTNSETTVHLFTMQLHYI